MDKIEYQEKLEDIKALAEEGNFREAADMADTIDWRHVKSVRTLYMIGEIYEADKLYEDAIRVLKYAYKRSSTSKTVVYRLAELSLRVRDIPAAREYAKELSALAPHDSSRYVLDYKVKRAEGRSLEEQIKVLEKLKEREYTERWSYELARLYLKAGQEEKCVETCDDLILWFSEGKYVIKAMELKMQVQPLTPAQKKKYDSSLKKKTEKKTEDKPSAAAPVSYDADAASLQAAPEKEPSKPEDFAVSEKAAEEAAPYPAEETDKISENAVKSAVREGGRRKKAAHIAETIDKMDEAAAASIPEDKAAGASRVNIRRMNGENIGSFTSTDSKDQLANSIRAVFSGLQKPAPSLDDMPEITEHFEEADLQEESSEKESEYAGYRVRNLEPESVKDGVVVTGTEDSGEHQMSLEDYRKADEIDLNALFAETSGALAGEIASGDFAKTGLVEPENENADRAEADGNAEVSQAGQPEEVVEEAAEQPEMSALSEPENEIADGLSEVGEENPASEKDEDIALTPESETLELTPEAEKAVIDASEASEETESTESTAGKISSEEDETIISDAGDVEIVPTVPAEDEELPLSDSSENDGLDAKENDSLTDTGEIFIFNEIVEETPAGEKTAEEDKAPEPFVVENLPPKAGDQNLGLTREFNFEKELEKVMRTGVSREEALREVAGRASDEAAAATEGDRPMIDVTQQIPSELLATEEEIKSEYKPDMANLLAMDEEEEVSEVSQAIINDIMEKPETMDFVPVEPRRLSESETKIFTYFAPIPGIAEQVTQAIADVHNNAGDKTSRSGNVILVGRQGSGKTRLAESLILAICQDLHIKGARTAHIDARDFNKKDPAKVVSRMAGGFLVIEGAGSLTGKTIQKLSQAMEFRTDDLVVILEDEKQDLNEMLEKNPEFAEKFTSRIVVPVFTNDELVTFGKTYTKEKGYKMDEMCVLALYTMIGDNQKDREPVTVGKVQEMIDQAIARSERGTRKLSRRLSRKETDQDGRIILHEKDFDF